MHLKLWHLAPFWPIIKSTSFPETIFKNYTSIQQIIEVAYLIYNQITIDIFFIDWERPRARNSVPRAAVNGSVNSDLEEQQPVSIWRTYFVANEWNEIQTKRKLNINIHLLITIFILKVKIFWRPFSFHTTEFFKLLIFIFFKECGLEHWATSDPELHTSLPEDSVGNPISFTCRFAVGGLVYITSYIVQVSR